MAKTKYKGKANEHFIAGSGTETGIHYSDGLIIISNALGEATQRNEMAFSSSDVRSLGHGLSVDMQGSPSCGEAQLHYLSLSYLPTSISVETINVMAQCSKVLIVQKTGVVSNSTNAGGC